MKSLSYGIYTALSDPFAYCTHIFYPSYVSSWNALQYYGLTTQMPETITVTSYKKFRINGIEIIRSPFLFGFTKVKYFDSEIFMGTREKAVLDSVAYKLVSFEDLSEMLPKLNRNRLEEYSIKCGKKNARIMWYLMDKEGLNINKIRKFISGDCVSSNDILTIAALVCSLITLT
ncbi:MAG: type IV toxin-antitoxin system AbiEi family antitoxin domain-containing protein [Cuniculiplasma sp.]